MCDLMLHGKKLHVRVDSLRPLSVNVDEKIMPKGDGWRSIGLFVVFEAESGISGGIITSTSDQTKVSVHEHMPVICKTGVTWAPMWVLPDGGTYRQMKAKNNHPAHIISVQDDDIISTVTLKGKKFDADSITRLENLGYDIFTPL